MKEIGWKAQTIAVLINFHYINVYILVYISFTPSQSGSFPTLFFQSRAKVKAQQQHANTTISSLQLRVYHIFLRLLSRDSNTIKRVDVRLLSTDAKLLQKPCSCPEKAQVFLLKWTSPQVYSLPWWHAMKSNSTSRGQLMYV